MFVQVVFVVHACRAVCLPLFYWGKSKLPFLWVCNIKVPGRVLHFNGQIVDFVVVVEAFFCICIVRNPVFIIVNVNKSGIYVRLSDFIDVLR